MICDTCGQPTDMIYEVHGYLGIYCECANCFGKEDDDMVNVDYYTGRLVESVEDGGPDKAAWTINLEGDAHVYCFDESHEKPELDGLALTSVESLDDQRTVRLYFGSQQNPGGVQINLQTDKYGFSDAQYTQGEIVREGTREEYEAPQEEPVERIAEGPTGPEQVRLVKNDETSEWHFNAEASNGEIVSTSETYKNKSDAKREAKKLFGEDVKIVEGARESS